jgi:hypothetical protein
MSGEQVLGFCGFFFFHHPDSHKMCVNSFKNSAKQLPALGLRGRGR